MLLSKNGCKKTAVREFHCGILFILNKAHQDSSKIRFLARQMHHCQAKVLLLLPEFFTAKLFMMISIPLTAFLFIIYAFFYFVNHIFLFFMKKELFAPQIRSRFIDNFSKLVYNYLQ